MHGDCLQRSNHHCHHAHQCTNPRHSKSGERQKSRENAGNIAANLHHASRQDLLSGKTRKVVNKPAATHSATTKPACLSPHTHEPNTLYERTLGCLKEKQRRVDELQQELSKLRARRQVRDVPPPKEPSCLVQKEDYEAMYRFVRFENDRMKLEVQEWRTMHQIALAELEMEREKAVQLQQKAAHRDHECERLAFLEQEVARLEKIKKEHDSLLIRSRKQEEELRQLRNKLAQLAMFKDKAKDSCKGHLESIRKLGQEKEALMRQRDMIRQRYDEHARHNVELTDKLKELKERNRIASEELNAECREKVKAADIKFGFSCDQINALRSSETKLKAKVKELEETLKSQQGKAKVAQETKVEKELRGMYDKSTKENESLRERNLKYQHENETLKETLRELRTVSESSKKELEEVIRLKELENGNLQTAKAQTERQILKLQEAERSSLAALQQFGLNKQTIAEDSKNRRPQSPERPHEPSNVFDTQQKENIDLFGSSANQRVQVQTLQRRNAELEDELGNLQSRLMTVERQASGSNWSQFELIIQENNRRIRELIIEKGKETEANSFLRAEVEQLKNRLSQPVTPDHTTNELYERSLGELQRLKNDVADRDFELLQLRKEVYEVNNQYSDYYILREDNETLRERVNELADLVETLKRSGIHNSYQKQELILENQFLTDQVERSRAVRQF